VETDAGLRNRQSISTALPSLSIFEGTAGAVAQLPGVTRLRAYENDTSIYDVRGISPHSICFVVEGGDAQAVGEMLALKKGPGCGTHGNVSVNTVDQYGSPCTIRFYRPVIDAVRVVVRIKPLGGYLAITGQNIRRNVAEYVNSMHIGDSVLLSRLYTPINAAEPDLTRRTFDVREVRIGPKDGTTAAANLLIAFNHAASCSVDDVELQEY
jgi:hypothetical protein